MASGFATEWAARDEWPYLVIVDAGPGFTAFAFQTMPGTRSVVGRAVDARGPRQIGCAERAGAAIKSIPENIIRDRGILAAVEFDVALAAAVESRSRYVNRSGFSARQLVFGSSRRVPGSLFSDGPRGWQPVAVVPTAELQWACEVGQAAQRA